MKHKLIMFTYKTKSINILRNNSDPINNDLKKQKKKLLIEMINLIECKFPMNNQPS